MNSPTPPPSPATPTDCPRTRALLDQLSRFGYSAANDRATTMCWELERELASLQSRLAEVERDAARYRWLRDTHHLRVGPDAWIRTGEDLEEAIDAALSAASVDGDKGEGK